MSKAPSMYTTTGWILFVPCVLIRIPFILIKLIAECFIKLNKFNEKVLKSLPRPAGNPEYDAYITAKAHEAIDRRFRRG
jgi:hypothetical protein